MRILLLTTHINIGGIGIYTVNLAKYLKKAGHEVVIGSSGGELYSELKKEKIEHIDLDVNTKFEFGIKVWKALPGLKKILKQKGIQVIHAQTRVSQVISFLLQKLTGIPYVTTCHGFFNHDRLSRKILPCWGERIIAISKSVEKHLLGDFHVSPSRIRQVYNGIELDRFIDIGEEKDYVLLEKNGIFPDDIIVGSIGRLSPVKGYRYLIEGFNLIKEKYQRAKLLFVGEGPEEELLRQKVEHFGLGSRAIFLKGGDMPEKYLPLFNVFCLPSVHEGLGLSIMEAMAAGKVCIASNVGGIVELIDDKKNGLLFEPENPEQIALTLKTVLNDPDLCLRLSDNAREKARMNFSMSNTVEKTISVYAEVVKPGIRV